MSKRNILIASLVGIVLFIVGIVLGGIRTTPGASPNTVGLILYLLGALVSLVAWIMGIVKTAQIRRWGWLVVVVILGSLGTLIYGIAGPETAKA